MLGRKSLMGGTRIRPGCLGAALVGGVLASFATMAVAQSFPPFPEPAEGPFPNTKNMRLLSQLLPEEIGAVTPRGSRHALDCASPWASSATSARPWMRPAAFHSVRA